MANVQSIEQEISQLPKEKQWDLLQYLLQSFSPEANKTSKVIRWASIAGSGKGLWGNIDAQEYVNELRRDR